MSLLELRGIGMEYGAIRALAEIDYAVAAGEIVCLIGDNGAGKSTLVKIIAGNSPPTHGTMHFEGRPVRFRGPEHARNVGIKVVYQDLALADMVAGLYGVMAVLVAVREVEVKGARGKSSTCRCSTRCSRLSPPRRQSTG